MATAMMMRQEIPEEVINDILRRLPISGCIVRFRCVRKSWLALLSDPSFILRDDKSVDSRRLQIMINFLNKNRRSVYSLYSAETLEPLLPSPVPLPEIQGTLHHWGLQVAGCCNGLICISHGHDDLILWNPATSETKVIPHSRSYPPYILNLGAVGFGFDSETNDYEILTQFDNEDEYHCFFEVYSLRNNSWTSLSADDNSDNGYKPWLPHHQIPQCYKGKLYWWDIMRDMPPELRLQFDSFDLSSQEFETLDLPCPFKNLRGRPQCLLKEESMVALFPIHDDTGYARGYPTCWEIWVLLKYWVSEFWTRLVVITKNSSPGMSIWDSFGITRNLKFLFEAVHSSKMREGYDYYLDDNASFTGLHPETGKFSDLVQVQATRLHKLVMIEYMPTQVSIRDYCMSS